MLREKPQHLIVFWVAIAAQFILLLQLIGVQTISFTPLWWLCLHIMLNAVSAYCAVRLLNHVEQRINHLLALFIFICIVGVFLPLIGSTGIFLTLLYGIETARRRHREPDYWQLTPLAPLPYSTPKGRSITRADGRGFVEHLMYSSDDKDLYRKVLSAANIKVSLSVSALKQAMQHSDEHIRLSAYKTLDRKVTKLNQQIQYLEAQASSGDTLESSNIWLQISSNYWELLTLEDAESVARQQLLHKAAQAAIHAISALPDNRNAHYVLGRISLMQGKFKRARTAFKRSRVLGMPADKVLPYLAETAFSERDYARVATLLRKLQSATKPYPPLSHVVEYWS